jgi:hypothetical protein
MLITDIMTAFRQGKELANAETWKNRAVLLNALVAFFAAALGIAKGLGYAIDIDHDTLQNLAAGVVAAVGVFNSVMHVVTSQRVGLPPVGDNG